jgi:lysyl-tRNA synthetase class 2
MALRGHGKAGFAHLLDGSGRIQLYFRKDALGEAYAHVRAARRRRLDRGRGAAVPHPHRRDHRCGVERLELLSKSLRPLPEKWHGLKDPETASASATPTSS